MCRLGGSAAASGSAATTAVATASTAPARPDAHATFARELTAPQSGADGKVWGVRPGRPSSGHRPSLAWRSETKCLGPKGLRRRSTGRESDAPCRPHPSTETTTALSLPTRRTTMHLTKALLACSVLVASVSAASAEDWFPFSIATAKGGDLTKVETIDYTPLEKAEKPWNLCVLFPHLAGQLLALRELWHRRGGQAPRREVHAAAGRRLLEPAQADLAVRRLPGRRCRRHPDRRDLGSRPRRQDQRGHGEGRRQHRRRQPGARDQDHRAHNP